MATQLELADAQLTGFAQARDDSSSIINLVQSMGLKKSEWKKLKEENRTRLNESDLEEVEKYFNR